MRGLSGGQKVKVVLAAATWRRPHVVILDEPTNYLDRESLAALIEALKSYEGGVLGPSSPLSILSAELTGGCSHHSQPRVLRVHLLRGLGDARRLPRGVRPQCVVCLPSLFRRLTWPADWVEGQGTGERIDKKAGEEEETVRLRPRKCWACADWSRSSTRWATRSPRSRRPRSCASDPPRARELSLISDSQDVVRSPESQEGEPGSPPIAPTAF